MVVTPMYRAASPSPQVVVLYSSDNAVVLDQPADNSAPRHGRATNCSKAPMNANRLAYREESTHSIAMKRWGALEWGFIGTATVIVTCLFTIEGMTASGLPFAETHSRQIVSWGVWLLLSPAIIATAQRYPFGVGPLRRWIASQAMLAVAVALTSGAIAIVIRATRSSAPLALSPKSLISTFAGDLLRYLLLSLSYQAIVHHRAVRERDAREAQLRAELAEAKLAGVQAQLQPHFLFNTLNAIAALVREDPARAEAMVEQLSELLRASLISNVQTEVSLDQELRLTQQYLAIQSVRFRDRLQATVFATDAARRARIPQLILQPLVENAIHHGITSRERCGALAVRAVVKEKTLVVTIEDDGVGIGNAPASRGSGVGLKSVRSRLLHLYGDQQRFDLRPRSPTGTTVMITLPYRPEGT